VKFLFDEGLPFRLVVFLEQEGHDVIVCDRDRPSALHDRQILAIAFAERRVPLTNDKGFGDLVFRERLPHAGVILFRLGYVSIDTRLELLQRVLHDHGNELDQFIVATPRGSRVATTASD
jgi:predicted nuclease of predicted toxin-antitoxin system